MNLKAFKNRIFSTVFLTVRFEQRACSVDILYTKNSQILSNEHKKFKSYDTSIPMDAIQFIKKIESKYKICYTSTIIESISQSITPECMSEGVIEEDDYAKVCLFKGFGVIVRKDDIDETKRLFEKTKGLDFLYSPYVILWKSIESLVDEEKRLYVLNLESSITIAIGNRDGFEYGAFFHMISSDLQKIEDIPEDEPQEEDDSDLSEDIALEEESHQSDEVAELEDLDELSNLESLEDDDEGGLEEFEESDEAKKEESEESSEKRDEKKEPKPEESFEEFARGVDIINYAKESIQDYYQNPNLDSAFIDTIVIMDNAGLKSETIDYMMDSLLLEIKKEDISCGKIINELSFKEVEDEI